MNNTLNKACSIQEFICELKESIDIFETTMGQYKIQLTQEGRVTSNNRKVLIGWIDEITKNYLNLRPDMNCTNESEELIHKVSDDTKIKELAIYLIDRYQASVPIDKSELQLLGCVAFSMAMKYDGHYFDTDLVILACADQQRRVAVKLSI